MKVALIVVDLQEDFLPPKGSLAIQDGRSIIPLINKLVMDYPWSSVVATQDWHPVNHTSFASQHNVEPFTELEFNHPLGKLDDNTLQVITKSQMVWPNHCIENTSGACLDPTFLATFNLIPANVDKVVIQKGMLQDREYYLCFQDCWNIHHTKLHDYLTKLNITDVVFVGLAYDYCVYNSAKDCATLNFNTFVVKSCCKSVAPESIDQTDTLYQKAGITILKSVEEVANIFNK